MTTGSTGVRSVYGNRTENDQIKTYNNRITSGGGVCSLANPGNNISGCVGDRRGYLLDTVGIDVYNTTRFNVGDWRNALTYGFDAFQDEVSTFDTRGNSNVTTPGGQRTVSGGFVQLKNNYSTWLEVVSADQVRPLRFELSPAVSTGGDRFSPKITVGVTPVSRLHALCQLCRRLSCALDHGNADRRRPCDRRRPRIFPVRAAPPDCSASCPDPSLRPEVGKNKEVGLNLKY